MSTRNLLELAVEIESDILLLAALVEEVRTFGELLTTESFDPELTAYNSFNYNQALDTYTKHILYLTPRLEEYVADSISNGIPVNINNYRILKELREITNVQAK